MGLSGNTFFFFWEVSLMAWLQANISDAWISFMSFFSLFGEELPLILIVGFVYWSYDKKLGRKVGLIAIMIPLLTGISRFVVGAHYPTDVMVRCIRYAIIAFVDFGVYPMLFKFEKRKCFNKI